MKTLIFAALMLLTPCAHAAIAAVNALADVPSVQAFTW
jgi:hypothetical protein